MVLWWIEAGRTPTVADAERRLDTLKTLGPSPAAFTFREHFPAPDADERPHMTRDARQLCPAG
jgi:hypothetical protein